MNGLIQTPRTGWGLIDDEFDNLFQGFFRPLRRTGEGPQAPAEGIAPALDVLEREDAYVVRAEMPGINKDNIEVTLADGVLTIAGESRQESEEKEGERLIRRERRYGKYTRTLRVGTQVDEKNVKAAYKDGILEVTLPKAEEVKPKKITIG
jgi:HSP20 family protein